VSLVISQRLIKTVCPKCSTIEPPSEEEVWLFESYLNRLGEEGIELPNEVVRANHEGCIHCKGGYNGQAPIFESLPMSREARNDALEMVVKREARHAEVARHRSLTLMHSAMEMVSTGRAELISILT
jgi:type II secretory ATPase GspE/PulE/Tfp pilus assembly ATPase PilB-like protein